MFSNIQTYLETQLSLGETLYWTTYIQHQQLVGESTGIAPKLGPYLWLLFTGGFIYAGYITPNALPIFIAGIVMLLVGITIMILIMRDNYLIKLDRYYVFTDRRILVVSSDFNLIRSHDISTIRNIQYTKSSKSKGTIYFDELNFEKEKRTSTYSMKRIPNVQACYQKLKNLKTTNNLKPSNSNKNGGSAPIL